MASKRSEFPQPPCATIPETLTLGSVISTLRTMSGVPAEVVRYSVTFLAYEGAAIKRRVAVVRKLFCIGRRLLIMVIPGKSVSWLNLGMTLSSTAIAHGPVMPCNFSAAAFRLRMVYL